MKPYFADSLTTLYNGDSREILPQLGPVHAMISDPPWGGSATIAGNERPAQLLAEVLAASPPFQVLVLEIGQATDPRLLLSVPITLRFSHSVWLQRFPVTIIGTRMISGSLAYVFGTPPNRLGGGMLRCERWPGFVVATCHNIRGHPCESPPEWYSYLIAAYARGVVLDPFAGSGVVLEAARRAGLPSIGIEIDERYCEIAARVLSQMEMFAPPPAKVEVATLFPLEVPDA